MLPLRRRRAERETNTEPNLGQDGLREQDVLAVVDTIVELSVDGVVRLLRLGRRGESKGKEGEGGRSREGEVEIGRDNFGELVDEAACFSKMVLEARDSEGPEDEPELEGSLARREDATIS